MCYEVSLKLSECSAPSSIMSVGTTQSRHVLSSCFGECLQISRPIESYWLLIFLSALHYAVPHELQIPSAGYIRGSNSSPAHTLINKSYHGMEKNESWN
jgi:hypothetical protein